MKIIQATTQKHFFDLMDIRSHVFISEQNVDPTIEIDDIDRYAIHFIAYNDDNQPCGTCRLFFQDNVAFIGRLAVKKTFRNQGIASALLKVCEQNISHDISSIHLHAQVQAKPLYVKNGYIASGDIFYDANIEHVLMIKDLKKAL